MKHDTIKTDNYLLVVDESSIKNGDWVYFECLPYTEIKQVTTIINNAFDSKEGFGYGLEYCKKVIAHLPLNGSPFLEGVDFLPPLEVEDVEKLALDIFPRHEDWRLNSDNADKRPIWIDGYNQAKEKYKYTEEDLRKAFLKGISVTREGYNAEYARDYEPNIECVFGEKADKFIQSLSQPKMPIGFERELVNIMGKGEPVTERNSQGHIQWVGTYIYG